MAYIAYHFNWSKQEILTMTHKERRKWVSVIARMNQEMNESNLRAYQQRLEQLKNEQQVPR